ncbi:MAG: HD domain-containing protein [Caldilineaceae bacterium]|nr:HD domain-containing protein [Caldilineaceae bacterium]
MSWTPRHPAFQALLYTLSQESGPVYVVGGAVRDFLLGSGSAITDLDVVVEYSAVAAARRVADKLGWAVYPLDSGRDVARLIFTAGPVPLVCDVAAMRGGTIESDLLARDFTVNAMALRWMGRGAAELLDPAHGQDDIKSRLLRRVTPLSLADDPIRLLRIVRLALQLDFSIEEETLVQLLRIGDTIKLASPERVRDELWKMFGLPAADQALEQLHQFGLLRPLLPELAAMEHVAQTAPHDTDVYHHTVRVVRHAAALREWIKGVPQAAVDETTAAWQKALAPWRYRLRQHMLQTVAAERMRVDWLVWFALWHDVGKTETRSTEHLENGAIRYRFLGHEDAGAVLAARRLEALHFSRIEIDLTQAVIRAHMRPHHLYKSFSTGPISHRARFRFFRDSGGRTVDAMPGIDTLLLALADYQGIYSAFPPPNWDQYLRHVAEMLAYAFDEDGLVKVRTPLVDGRMVMAHFDIAPGPELGRLLEHLHEAQAAGEVRTQEEALALAADWLAKPGASDNRQLPARS